MEKSTKKVIGIISILVMIGVFAFGIYFLAKNWNNFTDNMDIVEAQRTQIIELQEDIGNLNNELTITQNEKGELQVQVKVLQQEKVRLQKEMESNAEKFEEKKKEYMVVEQQLKLKENQLQEKEARIEELESQITPLQNKVVELTAQLEAYKDMTLTGLYECKFMDGDNVVSVQYIKEEQPLVYVPTVENTETSWCYGWALEENAEVAQDITNYVPTADTIFYAVKGECVNFKCSPDEYTTANDKDIYRVGADVTIREALNISDEIWSNENITVLAYDRQGANRYQISDFNTKIKDLNYGILYQTQLVHEETTVNTRVYGYCIQYSVRYNLPDFKLRNHNYEQPIYDSEDVIKNPIDNLYLRFKYPTSVKLKVTKVEQTFEAGKVVSETEQFVENITVSITRVNSDAKFQEGILHGYGDFTLSDERNGKLHVFWNESSYACSYGIENCHTNIEEIDNTIVSYRFYVTGSTSLIHQMYYYNPCQNAKAVTSEFYVVE